MKLMGYCAAVMPLPIPASPAGTHTTSTGNILVLQSCLNVSLQLCMLEDLPIRNLPVIARILLKILAQPKY